MMARDPIDLLHGTLDVLVLKTLSWGPMHGYGRGVSDNNRKAKFYRLTARGRQELRAETNAWRQYATAIFSVLETA